MAQLLISHKFQSGIIASETTHQTHSAHVELAYKFSIESDQKYGNARCLKKVCLKIQYRAWIKAK